MKKVTIYSNLFDFDPAFSITRIINEQIGMLLRHGYKPSVIVSEGFQPKENFSHPDVELVYIPTVPVSNDGSVPEDWKEHIDKLFNALGGVFSVSNVVISHDIIWRPDLVMYNFAMRKMAEKYPLILWLNWIHSATSPKILCKNEEVLKFLKTPFRNSYIVYPNPYEIPRVAQNFGYEEDMVKFCYHPTDIAGFFEFHPETKKLIDEHDLYNADVIIVYPVRMDRGKQPHKILGIAMALEKERGLKTKLILCDFHSTGGDKVVYRNEMKKFAEEKGFEGLIFTSDNKETEIEVPRKVVADLFILSNVFILPSRSETYSLIAQEAALAGNLLILNQDFPPFRSIYGEFPKYYQFSSNINANSGYDGVTDTQYDNEEGYYKDIANYIHYMIQFNPVLHLKTKLRKERNPDAIFKKYMEPLLHING